ncbi:hypothetical protein BC01_054 [Bacillus phage BC01]|nr:hypothetical protein BC01_054 [Bacillus phage BC01]
MEWNHRVLTPPISQKILDGTRAPGFVFGMLLRLDSHNCIYKLNGQAGENYMISSHYEIYCDECADMKPLVAQLLTEARSEAMNMGWTSEKVGTGAQQWYCPTCSLKKADQEANGAATEE